MYLTKLIHIIRSQSLDMMLRDANKLPPIGKFPDIKKDIFMYIVCISDEMINQYTLEKWRGKVYFAKQHELDGLIKSQPKRSWDHSDKLLNCMSPETTSLNNELNVSNLMHMSWNWQSQLDWPFNIDLGYYHDDIHNLNDRISNISSDYFKYCETIKNEQ